MIRPFQSRHKATSNTQRDETRPLLLEVLKISWEINDSQRKSAWLKQRVPTRASTDEPRSACRVSHSLCFLFDTWSAWKLMSWIENGSSYWMIVCWKVSSTPAFAAKTCRQQPTHDWLSFPLSFFFLLHHSPWHFESNKWSFWSRHEPTSDTQRDENRPVLLEALKIVEVSTIVMIFCAGDRLPDWTSANKSFYATKNYRQHMTNDSLSFSCHFLFLAKACHTFASSILPLTHTRSSILCRLRRLLNVLVTLNACFRWFFLSCLSLHCALWAVIEVESNVFLIVDIKLLLRIPAATMSWMWFSPSLIS